MSRYSSFHPPRQPLVQFVAQHESEEAHEQVSSDLNRPGLPEA